MASDGESAPKDDGGFDCDLRLQFFPFSPFYTPVPRKLKKKSEEYRVI